MVYSKKISSIKTKRSRKKNVNAVIKKKLIVKKYKTVPNTKKYKTVPNTKKYKTLPNTIPTNTFQKAKKYAFKKYNNNNSPNFRDAVVAIMSN